MVDEEKQLTAAIRAGDEDAATSFYEEYCDKIYRMMYFSTTGEVEAEELTRATFLAFFESLPRFRGESKLSTWLYGIAKNILKNHYSRNHRHKTISLDDEAAAAEVSRYLAGAAGEDPPEQLVSRDETVGLVRAVLGALSPSYREILTLRYLNDMSNAEVAGALGKTEGNVRVLLHRAGNAFARELRRLEGRAGERLVERPRSCKRR
jgi:RNA polymerase sigma-70 factor (ECF subfamily)